MKQSYKDKSRIVTPNIFNSMRYFNQFRKFIQFIRKSLGYPFSEKDATLNDCNLLLNAV
ncbi:32886_t:CDS:2 [Gigaspora margarita]|uniref:32886_t:CDS:1 n=1 Tax=Gigaspora margarita TaxID=4874 RepID=A0ABM8W2H8_GIGMA|nr:32886_t:CDS:2 [Gigaspora margarita]